MDRAWEDGGGGDGENCARKCLKLRMDTGKMQVKEKRAKGLCTVQKAPPGRIVQRWRPHPLWLWDTRSE
jgi:hypothetical protein